MGCRAVRPVVIYESFVWLARGVTDPLNVNGPVSIGRVDPAYVYDLCAGDYGPN